MKTHLLFISLVFACFFTNAQKREVETAISDNADVTSEPTPVHNFHIENNGLIYKYVFETTELSETQIIENINSLLSNSTGLKNVNFSNNEFAGRIENFTIDYRKYGGTLFNTLTALNNPMFADFKIQIRDKRYRLIVSNIEFINPSPYFIWNLYSLATKQNRTGFKNQSAILKGLEYIDSCLKEKFEIDTEKSTDEW